MQQNWSIILQDIYNFAKLPRKGTKKYMYWNINHVVTCFIKMVCKVDEVPKQDRGQYLLETWYNSPLTETTVISRYYQKFQLKGPFRFSLIQESHLTLDMRSKFNSTDAWVYSNQVLLQMHLCTRHSITDRSTNSNLYIASFLTKLSTS